MSAFGTDDFPPPSLEDQQRMKQMTPRQLKYNINMLQDIRLRSWYKPQETPCQTFYKLKKYIPLSVFIEVYPFNELVDCSSSFQLEELKELKRLYFTLEENDQQFYIDSFRRLQELINSIQSNKIPGSYGKGFQHWKEQVAANQEVQDVLRNPEPRQEYIDEIAAEYYMQNRIPSTTPTPPAASPAPASPAPTPASPAQPPAPTLFSRIKGLFGSGGGRKTTKKMYQKRSRSRSTRSRSKSRSKK